MGNDIFFALSGFFAVYKSGGYSKEYFFKIRYIIKYYLKRVVRIIPVFWFYLFFVTILFWGTFYLFNDFSTESSLILNMFFIKSKGHLWFLQQEILFYISVPFILIILSLMKKGFYKMKISKVITNLICTILLFVSAMFLIKNIEKIPIITYGNGNFQYFRIGYFVLGIGTGYLYNTYEFIGLQFDKKKIYRILSNFVVFSFIIFCILSSNKFLSIINTKYQNYYIGWQKPEFCVIYSCIVIFLLVTSNDTVMSKFMGNKFFAFVGKISFCMYLFHWPFLTLNNPSPMLKFSLVYFVTICVTIVIHKYIEEPTINLSKKIKYKN